jgi:hypothetical protein
MISNSRAEEYRQEAEHCAELAKAALDPFVQRMYQDMEMHWLQLVANAKRKLPLSER